MVWTYRVAAVGVAVALAALQPPAAAQEAAQSARLESFAGVWEGSAQTPNGDVSLRAAFTVQDGKLGGTIESSMGPITVVTSTFANGKLTMTIDLQGGAGTLGCQLTGTRIEGIWEYGSETGPFWLARPGAGDGGSAGEPISGTWAGEVDIAGQIMPFSMDLRLSGEAVTGEMISAMGKVPLASGSWKDGALQLAFPYTGGEPVVMGATIKDGKLVGLVDYNRGEASGTWSAAKK